ncbi:hypothetical protein [Pyrolobus fumarii]|uniref:hypothetical protein n=1 Tax=Pyrolobus fumarii TaxID=54252 RepID=UPI00064E340E|nr:hypothetical protein [Pyrolobus fumarii]
MQPAAQHLEKLSIESLEARVKEAEDYASRVVDEMLKEARERIILAFASMGDTPAWIAYWMLREVAPTAPVEIYEGDALAFHILAYRRSKKDEYGIASDTTIYAFVGPGGENQLVFIRDAALHTGAALVVITPKLPPIIEERLGPEPLLVEPPGPYPLSASILAARLAAGLVEKLAERNVRVERVTGEARDLRSVVRELVEKHGADASRVLECKGSCATVYTPTLKGPAMLASRINGSRPLSVQEMLALIAAGTNFDKVSLMYTTTDEDVVREVRFKSMTSGASLAELRLQTDPVTAPLYATMLLYARL